MNLKCLCGFCSNLTPYNLMKLLRCEIGNTNVDLSVYFKACKSLVSTSNLASKNASLEKSMIHGIFSVKRINGHFFHEFIVILDL